MGKSFPKSFKRPQQKLQKISKEDASSGKENITDGCGSIKGPHAENMENEISLEATLEALKREKKNAVQVFLEPHPTLFWFL